MTPEERRRYKAEWERRKRAEQRGVPFDESHVYKPYAQRGIRSKSHAEYMREWRRRNVAYRLAEKKVFRARLRARRYDAPTDRMFTASDVLARYDAQAGRCYYCGSLLTESYTVDHLRPLSRGGTNDPDNVVVACKSCNDSKGVLLSEEFAARTSDWR